MTTANKITCKTTAVNCTTGSGGAARPQGGGTDEQRGLMAPTAAEDEEGGDHLQRLLGPGGLAPSPCASGEKIEAQEETADLKVAPAPVRPPPAVVEEHRVTHIPYRSWCDECARGRCLGEQRGRHVGRAHEIPRVGMDY